MFQIRSLPTSARLYYDWPVSNQISANMFQSPYSITTETSQIKHNWNCQNQLLTNRITQGRNISVSQKATTSIRIISNKSTYTYITENFCGTEGELNVRMSIFRLDTATLRIHCTEDIHHTGVIWCPVVSSYSVQSPFRSYSQSKIYQ